MRNPYANAFRNLASRYRQHEDAFRDEEDDNDNEDLEQEETDNEETEEEETE